MLNYQRVTSTCSGFHQSSTSFFRSLRNWWSALRLCFKMSATAWRSSWTPVSQVAIVGRCPELAMEGYSWKNHRTKCGIFHVWLPEVRIFHECFPCEFLMFAMLPVATCILILSMRFIVSTLGLSSQTGWKQNMWETTNQFCSRFNLLFTHYTL